MWEGEIIDCSLSGSCSVARTVASTSLVYAPRLFVEHAPRVGPSFDISLSGASGISDIGRPAMQNAVYYRLRAGDLWRRRERHHRAETRDWRERLAITRICGRVSPAAVVRRAPGGDDLGWLDQLDGRLESTERQPAVTVARQRHRCGHAVARVRLHQHLCRTRLGNGDMERQQCDHLGRL